MMLKRLQWVLACVLLACAALAGAETRLERNVATGARFIEIHRNDAKGNPWAIYVLEMDRNARNLSLHSTKAKGHVLGGEPVRAQSQRVDPAAGEVVAAVNGDFYWTDKVFFGQPVGMQVTDGRILTGPAPNWSQFGVNEKGEPVLFMPELEGSVQMNGASWPVTVVNKARSAAKVSGILAIYTPSFGLTTRGEGASTDVVLKDIKPEPSLTPGVTYTGTIAEIRKEIVDSPIPAEGLLLSGGGATGDFLKKNAVVGQTVSFTVGLKDSTAKMMEVTGVHPILVQNGAVVLGDNKESLRTYRHPRTAVGWNDQKLYFVAVDGRQKGHSAGMTLDELAAFMLELGCKEAANLDGGGSTTMVVRGAVMNRPSDGVDRTVSNGWAVVSSAKPGALSELKVWPENPSVLTGSAISFEVTGQDADGNPVEINPSDVKWSSSSALGSIDAAGNFVAAKAPRAGLLGVSVGDATTSTTINVWDAPARLVIAPGGALTLQPGATLQLSAKAFDKANRPMAVDPSAITWNVTGSGMAIGSDGKLVAGSNLGSFSVTATVAGVSANLQGLVAAQPAAK